MSPKLLNECLQTLQKIETTTKIAAEENAVPLKAFLERTAQEFEKFLGQGPKPASH